MGGKTGTTTQQTSIPSEVLARYNSVNAQAQQASTQPFQQYSTDPNAFVAPLNEQQQAGISNINQYANAAQPGYQAGYGATNAAMQAIQGGQNVAQPYFQGAQTMAAGVLPQYQQAAGLANAAMDPLQQATYAAQPSYQTAQAKTMGAANQLGDISQGYNAQNYQQGVQGYMNPYLQNAMGSTAAMLQNQNQQQQQQLQGNAISQGAFGGDRGNIAQAALMGQQNLAMGQTLGQMANQGYQQSAQNYMSGLGQQANIAAQQGALANQYGQLGGQAQQALINAGLAQSQGAGNIANIAGQGMAGASQYGALGTAAQNAALQGVPLSLAAGAQYGQLGAGAQQAGLQGAQAQLGAGTLGQQTTQAGKTALYNQFLQQQAYPFQVAQFLANIAEGTGALSGSNTVTQQPMSFFSDRRLKEDIKKIGTAYNGLPIYTFKYKGDDSEQTHIGFMADEVEKKHPEAVGLSGGYKTVDYARAARSQGGLVGPEHEFEGYNVGGREHHRYGSSVGSDYDPYDPNSIQNIINRQQGIYANLDTHHVPVARNLSGGIGKSGRVPEGNLPVGGLRGPGSTPALPPSALEEGLSAVDRAQKLTKAFEAGNAAFTKGTDWLKQQNPALFNPLPNNPAPAGTPMPPDRQPLSDAPIADADVSQNSRGGRTGYALNGSVSEPTPEGLYSEDPQGGLAIPDENKGDKYKLLQQSQLPGTMQDPTAKDLMTFMAMLPKAYGGRTGYADKGAVEPDDVLQKYGPVIGGIESSNKYDALGPVTKSGDRAYGKYQVMGANIPSWTKEALGKPMTPEEFLSDTSAQDKVFSHHFGKALNQYGTPEDAASVWFSGKPRSLAGNAKDQLGTTVPSYISKFNAGLGAGSQDNTQAPQRTAGLVPQDNPADVPVANAVPTATAPDTTGGKFAVPKPDDQAAPDQEGGLVPRPQPYLPNQAANPPGAFDYLANKLGIPKELQDSTFWGTIATGLGTMASSRSPFLGAAALEGLAGAASAYPQLQRSKAETEATRAAAVSTISNIPKNLVVRVNGVDSVVGIDTKTGLMGLYNIQDANRLSADGSISVDPRVTAEYLKAHPEVAKQQEQRVEGAPVNTPPIALTSDERNAALDATKDVGGLDENQRNKIMQRDIFGNQAAEANNVRAAQPNIRSLGFALSGLDPNSAIGAGWYGPRASEIGQQINYLAHAAGYKGDLVSDQDLTNAQEAGKVTALLQGQAAQALDQTSYAALQSMLARFPTLANTPNGRKELMADIMALQQRELDKQDYFRQWQDAAKGQAGAYGGGNQVRYTGEQALENFNKHYSAAYYDAEKNVLKRMFDEKTNRKDANGRYRNYYNVLSSGDAAALTPDDISALAQKYGAPVLRYFNVNK